MTNELPRELYVDLDFYSDDPVWWCSAYKTRVSESTTYILADRVEKMIQLAKCEAFLKAATKRLLFSEREPSSLSWQINKLKEELR